MSSPQRSLQTTGPDKFVIKTISLKLGSEVSLDSSNCRMAQKQTPSFSSPGAMKSTHSVLAYRYCSITTIENGRRKKKSI